MLHIQTWSGSGSATITDMANAGKRGKTCRIVRFQGWCNGGDSPECRRANSLVCGVHSLLERMDKNLSIDAARMAIQTKIDQYAPLPIYASNLTEDTIRGVDAPREKLTAGVDGQWSAVIDERGIHVCDSTDQNNLPTLITAHEQRPTRAYELASKAWGRVAQAKTFSEVWSILTAAGCKCHYYCAMD